MKTKYIFILIASSLSFIAGMVSTAFYIQPKTTLEAIVGTARTISSYLNATTIFIDWYAKTVSNPHLATIFSILTAFSACVMTFAAWRLALISRGFRKSALLAGGSYVGVAMALSGLSEDFKKARVLLAPVAAVLFILVLLGLYLMRLNERAENPSIKGSQRPKKAVRR